MSQPEKKEKEDDGKVEQTHHCRRPAGFTIERQITSPWWAGSFFGPKRSAAFVAESTEAGRQFLPSATLLIDVFRRILQAASERHDALTAAMNELGGKSTKHSSRILPSIPCQPLSIAVAHRYSGYVRELTFRLPRLIFFAACWRMTMSQVDAERQVLQDEHRPEAAADPIEP